MPKMAIMTLMTKNIFTPGGIPMKLSLPRAFCCVLYAVCWLDTTSTFYQVSNDENDDESEEEENYRGKSGRRAARACGARRAVALAVVRPNGRTVEPEQVRETQRESLRARLLVSRVAKYLDSLLS